MDFRLLLLLEERTINCSLQLSCTLWIIKPCMHAYPASWPWARLFRMLIMIFVIRRWILNIVIISCAPSTVTPLTRHSHGLWWRVCSFFLVKDECAPCLVSLNLGLYYHNSAQFTKKINKYFKNSFDKKKMENANRKKLLELDKKNILKG